MNLPEQIIKPIIGRIAGTQWIVAVIVLGLYLGFIDTLLVGAFLGYLGIKVGA